MVIVNGREGCLNDRGMRSWGSSSAPKWLWLQQRMGMAGQVLVLEEGALRQYPEQLYLQA